MGMLIHVSLVSYARLAQFTFLDLEAFKYIAASAKCTSEIYMSRLMGGSLTERYFKLQVSTFTRYCRDY